MGGAADPLGRQTGARDDAHGDLGKLGEHIDREGPGEAMRSAAASYTTAPLAHTAIGSEAELLDDRWNPPRRSAGGQYESPSGGDCRGWHHGFGVMRSWVLSRVPSTSVTDQGGQHRWRFHPA